MEIETLSGSPRLLRNLNERAVLKRLLAEGPLTRMELEAFTGLSKPAMSDLLRRLEAANLIRRDGEKAGSFGPKAGLWCIEPASAFVGGIDVSVHGIRAAVADVTGRTVASSNRRCEPGERYDAQERLCAVIDDVARQAGISPFEIDQMVVGLPGIVDTESGNLRKGQQLPNWQGFHIPEALESVVGHRRVIIENDVNLVALEEMSAGAAQGVQSFILFWIGDGVGGAAVVGGKLLRGYTGMAGELGGTMVPDRMTAPGEMARMALLEDLLSPASIGRLIDEHGLEGEDSADAVAKAATGSGHAAFFADLSYRVAAGLTGAIGILDPEMVVLGGAIGHAAGRCLSRGVTGILKTLPIALPQIVPSAVGVDAIRAGAVELALDHARERLFAGGSAARGQP
jgi:predicted NBD/HSP70 family sugar kinase